MKRPALLAGVCLLSAVPALAQAPGSQELPATYHAMLRVDELGVKAGLRIRVFHAPGMLKVPESAGHLFLVSADSARGESAFFIPTDLAFEFGEDLVYRVEFEQASDFFGQALGGRLRPGETQVGFILLPFEVGLDRFIPGSPEQVVVRYAHHRAPLHTATPDEVAWWSRRVEKPVLAAGLNLWWEWAQLIARAPEMSEGEQRQFAERMLPGMGHLLEEEDVSATALRNAILRVGERRLLDTRLVQHMQPRYPEAARRMGARGLVVVLAYITTAGEVGDALILASNTVHLLNLSALTASREFRYARARDEQGNPLDGWRLIPLHFDLRDVAVIESRDLVPAEGYQPPRIILEVEAEYPIEALNRNLEGTVVYLVKLDAEGRLKEAVLEQGVHPILDASALAAVERTRFLPATQDGEPVPSELRMPFAFAPKR